MKVYYTVAPEPDGKHYSILRNGTLWLDGWTSLGDAATMARLAQSFEETHGRQPYEGEV